MPAMTTVVPPRPTPPTHRQRHGARPTNGCRQHRRELWRDIARQAPHRADRQAIELVSRLFDAMLGDEPPAAGRGLLISRLHGPAMRLALRDTSLLDKGEHPLWHFINRLGLRPRCPPTPATRNACSC
jgi:hypothetical protein